MSVLVGTLAVDVVNGQATFTLDDAKSQLDSFGKKVKDTQETVDYSMREARGSVMAIGESFGVHLPREITTFIAALGPVGPALVAALPFAVIGLGAILLIEHLAKVREEAEKLALSQVSMGTTVQNTFNTLDEKILEAGIKADELNQNHLSALQKQLELIDRQSLHELAQQFDVVAGAAEKTLGLITEHWYESKIGVVGVKDALENFKAQYASLLAQGKDKEASDLLAGTLQSALKMKELMEAQQGGHGSTQTDLDAQNALIGALQAQVTIQEKLAALKNSQQQNVNTEEQHRETADADRLYKAQAEANQHAADLAEKIRAEQARQDLELARGEESESIKITVEGSQARIAAIDAALKRERSMHQEWTDYFKNLEAEKVRAVEAANNKEVSDLEKAINSQDKYNESIAREAEAKIKGAASDSETGIKDKASLGLISKREEQQQLQQIYQQELQSLLTVYAQELSAATQHRDQMAALAKSLPQGSEAQATALREAETEQDRMNKLVAQQAQLQSQLNRQIAQSQTAAQHLQSSWSDYFTKMKTETKDLGTTVRTNLQGSITQFTNAFAQDMAKSIVEGKNLGKSMREVAAQILESMISMLIRWVEQWIISHTVMAAIGQSTAATDFATQKAYAVSLAGANALASWAAAPWPIDAGAPTFAASMTAAAAAFEQGGIVPGYGIGDSVPARLSPGEMVLPKPISQGLQGAIQNGGLGGETHYHAPTFAPQVHALDSKGVDRVIARHADRFHKEFKAQARRRNK